MTRLGQDREAAHVTDASARLNRQGVVDPHLAEQVQRMQARGYVVGEGIAAWALYGLAEHYRAIRKLAAEVRTQEASPDNTPSEALTKLLDLADPPPPAEPSRIVVPR